MQQHKVEFNILCTVHAANADRPLEVYRFLRDEVGTPLHPVHPHRRAGQRERPHPSGGQRRHERSVKPEQ